MRYFIILACIFLFSIGCTEIKIRLLIEKAKQQEEEGNHISAIETYDSIIELGEEENIAYIRKGYLYIKSKEFTKAEVSFRVALKIEETNPRVYLGLSRLRL